MGAFSDLQIALIEKAEDIYSEREPENWLVEDLIEELKTRMEITESTAKYLFWKLVGAIEIEQ